MPLRESVIRAKAKGSGTAFSQRVERGSIFGISERALRRRTRRHW